MGKSCEDASLTTIVSCGSGEVAKRTPIPLKPGGEGPSSLSLLQLVQHTYPHRPSILSLTFFFQVADSAEYTMPSPSVHFPPAPATPGQPTTTTPVFLPDDVKPADV
jgi:hypothetical protein